MQLERGEIGLLHSFSSAAAWVRFGSASEMWWSHCQFEVVPGPCDDSVHLCWQAEIVLSPFRRRILITSESRMAVVDRARQVQASQSP